MTQEFTPLNNSSKLPVTDLNETPILGVDSNLNRYKRWKCYILSIKEDTERRKHVENLKTILEEKQIETELLDGFYYKTMDVVNKMESLGIVYDSPEYRISQSQIGCFLSHRQVWEKIKNEPDPDVISFILEDDMDLKDSDNFDLEYLLDDINELKRENRFDGIVLWKHPSKYTKTKNKTKYLQEFYYQWGLCAYCITKETAEQLLEIKRFYDPIDEIVFKDFFPNLHIFYSKREHFVNLGGLTSDDKFGKMFKSIIWT